MIGMPERDWISPGQAVKPLAAGLGIALLFAGLYAASLYNYLLFHTLAELFSIVIAGAIFIIAWNSREMLDNTFFLIIGIAYLFVGGIDLVHTMAYEGMNIFIGYGPNLPTQLWIAARYLEAGSLLAATFLIARKLRAEYAFAAYSAVFLLLMYAVFSPGLFPDAYIEGEGLTPFKVVSEYLISLMLLAAIVLVHRRREAFEPRVLRLMILAFIVTIAAELAFTLYVDVYGFFNMLGHILKILSFALIYLAVVETGIRRPYALVFRRLSQSEGRYRLFAENFPGIAFQKRPDFSTVFFHGAVEEITGYTEEDFVRGRVQVLDLVHPDDRQAVLESAERLRATPGGAVDREYRIVRRDGGIRWIREHLQSLTDGGGGAVLIQGTIQDISGQKHAENAIRIANEKLSLLNRINRHDILNQLNVILGYLDLSKDMTDDPELRTYMEKQEAAARAIERYTGFARDYQEMGVSGPLWQSARETFLRAVSPIVSGQIPVEADLEGLEILADPMLEMVFLNLADNSLRHGGPGLSGIRAHYRKEGGGRMTLIYEDDGEGVPPDRKDRIFTPGYGKNQGYGLFLVGKILEITGMSIRETGMPGRGARFEISIPYGAWRLAAGERPPDSGIEDEKSAGTEAGV